MNIEDANSIIELYSKWITLNMKAVQQGDSVMLVTPMLNRENDCMTVLIGEDSSGGYVVTDLGETIGNLEFSGFNVASGQRREKLEGILRGYGVKKTDDNEIYVKGSRDEIVQKMNMLFQAMASVDDLFFLSQESVRGLFMEDVGTWMTEHGIRYTAGPAFVGRSGLSYHFDYVISGYRDIPERLLKTVNTPSYNHIRNALFGWEDVKKARSDSAGYVFLNSFNLKDKKVPESVIDACSAYGMNPIVWGVNEDSYIEDLAA